MCRQLLHERSTPGSISRQRHPLGRLNGAIPPFMGGRKIKLIRLDHRHWVLTFPQLWIIWPPSSKWTAERIILRPRAANKSSASVNHYLYTNTKTPIASRICSVACFRRGPSCPHINCRFDWLCSPFPSRRWLDRCIPSCKKYVSTYNTISRSVVHKLDPWTSIYCPIMGDNSYW